MIVIAKSNILNESQILYYTKRGYSFPSPLNIVEHKNYKVEALAWKSERLWFYIFDESGTDYPIMYLNDLFTIVDGSIEASWVIATHEKSGATILSYSEWAQDENYYSTWVDFQRPISRKVN